MLPFTSRIVAAALLTALCGCVAAGESGHHAVPEAQPAAERITVTGTAQYRERMMPPPGAVLRVTLIDGSFADRAAPVLARYEQAVGGKAPPYQFHLETSRAGLEPNGRYMVRAVVTNDQGRLLWSSDAVTLIDPALAVQQAAPIMMVRVNAVGPALSEALTGTWQVRSIGGHPVSGGQVPTIVFSDAGIVSGSTGCNTYRGRYTVSGNAISLGPVAMTRRACVNDTGAQERAFITALAGVRAVNPASGPERHLLGPDGTDILISR
ncbi:MAG: META domain-containing protein [Proteobacteria bacterium]|nr:META domain-containing protein [Pseudomonadota bacterium]